jgi:hypothetical protein
MVVVDVGLSLLILTSAGHFPLSSGFEPVEHIVVVVTLSGTQFP